MIRNVVQDPSTVSSSGKPLVELPHGVKFRQAITHFDARGSVCEMFDERWDWHCAPMVFSYMFTLRPSMVKGWGMHMKHEDRYLVLFGEMEVIMYDTREESPTKGLISRVHLSEWDRRLMCIPTGIWHANYNPGNKDAVIINHPTQPYDHENPDKYRLPLDTPEIPFKFPPGVSGW